MSEVPISGSHHRIALLREREIRLDSPGGQRGGEHAGCRQTDDARVVEEQVHATVALLLVVTSALKQGRDGTKWRERLMTRCAQYD